MKILETVIEKPKIRTGSARPDNAVAFCKTHRRWLSRKMRRDHKCIRRDKNKRLCQGYLSLTKITDPELVMMLNPIRSKCPNGN